MSVETEDKVPGLWRDSNFLKFWGGETISQLGAQITQLALPLVAVLTLDATSTQTGVLNAASYAPFLLVTLFVGVWVDRVRRLPLMIVSNAARCLLVGAVPLLAFLGVLRIEHAYVIAFLVGVFTVIFDVSYQSYLPFLVRREQLVEGNSKLQATSSLAQIGGPGLAGLLLQVLSAPFALLANSASYMVSVISLSTIRKKEEPPRPPEVREPLRQQLAEGIGIIFRNPHLRACALQSGMYNLCWMSLQTVFVVYATRELGFSAGMVGALLSMGAVGALIGSIAAGPIKSRIKLGPAILLALLVCCSAPFLVPLAPVSAGLLTAAVLIAAFTLIGAGGTMANVHIISLRQAITPDRLLGRMNAGYRFISWGTLPLGALLGGWLGDLLGLNTTLYLTAAVFLSPVVIILFSPVWRLSDLPESVEEPTVGTEG